MSDVLTFEQVTFGYRPGADVLTGMDLAVGEGTATVVLGPNGTGKSTLLHLALGRLRPRSGAVLLRGRPLAERSRRDVGRTVALVPQAERTPFDYTVREFVLLGRAPYLAPLYVNGLLGASFVGRGARS